jgi:hypothetical protein
MGATSTDWVPGSLQLVFNIQHGPCEELFICRNGVRVVKVESEIKDRRKGPIEAEEDAMNSCAYDAHTSFICQKAGHHTKRSDCRAHSCGKNGPC